MQTLTTWLWEPLRWLDFGRSAVLTAMGPLLKPALLDRDKRAALVTSLTALVTLVGVFVAPVWWLMLTPLVWGVPHLLSDVRYLLVRQGLLRQPGWLAVAVTAATAALLQYGVRATLVGCAVLLLLPIAPIKRRALLALGVLPAAGVALWAGIWSDVVFAHAHNVLGLLFWWLWRPQTSIWKWWPLLVITSCSAILLSPLAEQIHEGLPVWLADPPGAGLDEFLRSLGVDGFWPGQSEGEMSPWPLRLVLWFAFIQSMHYVVWLHLIPSDDRARPTPRSFVASTRAWARDVSWPLVGASVAAMVWLAWLAQQGGLRAARDQYFVFAAAHGHVELLALVWLLLRGVRRAEVQPC